MPKHGIVGLTKSLAVMYRGRGIRARGRGIRANAIAPCDTRTGVIPQIDRDINGVIPAVDNGWSAVRPSPGRCTLVLDVSREWRKLVATNSPWRYVR